MNKVPARRVLVDFARMLGMIGGLGLAAAIVLAPNLLQDLPDRLAMGEDLPEPRAFVQSGLSDVWASSEFVDLARAVAAMPKEPKWEDVRALMEARGCTTVRYAVRFRWLLNDGTSGNMISLRTPYEDPSNAWEFLPLLRDPPGSLEFHLIDGQPTLTPGSDAGGGSSPEERIAEEFVNPTASRADAMKSVAKRRGGRGSGRPRRACTRWPRKSRPYRGTYECLRTQSKGNL